MKNEVENPLRDQIINSLNTLPDYETIEADSAIIEYAGTEKQVVKELEYHLKGNTYSKLLVKQFVELYENPFVEILGKKHPYNSHIIYLAIEKIINNEIKKRKFKRALSRLNNLNIYHSHHSQSLYDNFNFIRYFKNKYVTDCDIRNELDRIKEKNQIDDDNLMSTFMYNVLWKSFEWDKRTGQWIIYQKKENIYHFVCLYLHNEDDLNDEKLYEFIKDHIRNDL